MLPEALFNRKNGSLCLRQRQTGSAAVLGYFGGTSGSATIVHRFTLIVAVMFVKTTRLCARCCTSEHNEAGHTADIPVH